ncbi:tRNA uridine-5-carboxymethylaminomethyl(34) synthesis GTPase MnmE [Taibaiella koreensis]|uniref:tRNA uridine-5-carboxymethylaminomethyl(34) synthesis GTPase MnmE n=1 Tax=Taibaiella koreensis TaxID=1268548 RepID=UPI000E59C7AB|nr:tRNA uridine-5-carboxymethylaminomethyl(34) synthesis GTPase MnmE [Taibaiella koreensis]
MIANEQTIAAIATAPGIGAIGVIRLSGSDAITIADLIFKGKKLAAQQSHTLHFGHIVSPADGAEIDEVVVSLYRAPRSYTGENVVEISGHGAPYILQRILEVCIQAGARLAQPGEYTQRAFLNGKLDLAQAEAVADLIAADSFAAQQTALKQLKGGFSNDLKQLREQLIHFAALIELELDFAEEDVEFADRSQFRNLIDQLEAATTQLILSFGLGNAIKHGVSVAIIGKPNAGKSTLLNALLNEERAIVSNIAGTTRDTIEEVLNIKGLLFRLIDTAGIREHISDEIEQIGVGRSLEKMRSADVVIYLFDVQDTTPEELILQRDLLRSEGLRYLLVANKTDEQGEKEARMQFAALANEILFISAKSRVAVDQLKEQLYNLVSEGELNTENTIVTNARHHAALLKVAESLRDIEAGMDNRISGELMALDVRRCLHYLGEITGQVEVDRDILGTIFGKFCIGK